MKLIRHLLLAVICIGFVASADAANDKATNNRGAGYALDARGDVVLKALSFRVTADDIGTTDAETSLGYDLPAGAVVTEAYVNVITAEATGANKTIDVGTATADSGDPDAFLDGTSVATLGVLGAIPAVRFNNTTAKTLVVSAKSGDFAELEADIIIIYKEITD